MCVIDIFSKYAWVVPLRDKKGVSIVDAFWKILYKSGRKSNKIWVDKGSEFYNNSFKIKEIMKENLLLLKDLLEHQRLKSINT